jgi:hypothetical protein
MESIDLSTENPLDGSFLNISLEETIHTTKVWFLPMWHLPEKVQVSTKLVNDNGN